MSIQLIWLLVPLQEKMKNQSDQSHSLYSVTFRCSLHLIGQFGFHFLQWYKQSEIVCIGLGDRENHRIATTLRCLTNLQWEPGLYGLWF